MTSQRRIIIKDDYKVLYKHVKLPVSPEDFASPDLGSFPSGGREHCEDAAFAQPRALPKSLWQVACHLLA